MVEKNTYILAAMVTLIFILGGFAFNFLLSSMREQDLQSKLLDIKSSIAESDLEILYATQLTNTSCSILEKARFSITENLAETNRKLASYNEYNLNDVVFTRLKTDQTVQYVKTWLLTKKVNDICDTKINTVLFFFDVYSDDSKEQGYVLNTITLSENTTAFVVPLDFDFKLGIIKLLTSQFNITSAPSIVINEKTAARGLISRNDILKNFYNTTKNTD